MKKLYLEHRSGWTGAFTSQQAEGALPNGSRIMKIDQSADDGAPRGTRGTVLGSLDAANHDLDPGTHGKFFYFVEWDTMPRVAVTCIGSKLAAVSPRSAPCPAASLQT